MKRKRGQRFSFVDWHGVFADPYGQSLVPQIYVTESDVPQFNPSRNCVHCDK